MALRRLITMPLSRSDASRGLVAKPAPAPALPGLKRVLLVGNNYPNTPYELAGCVNDVLNMQGQLRSFFPSCKDYRVLTEASRQAILDGFAWLTTGLKPGENVMFHYSGHGGLVRDSNGDEISGYDSCIYPINKGQLEYIVDDEIRSLLAAKIPAGCKCLVILDCCHSGSAVDLRYMYQTPSAASITYTESTRYAKTSGQVVFLSGCRDDQTAADTVGKDNKPCGALTMALLDTWKKYGPAIKTKYLLWDVRTFLKQNGYDQVPQLTSGQPLDVNQVFDLRTI